MKEPVDPTRNINEDDEEEPFIKEGVEPYFSESHIKENINQVVEKILTFKKNVKVKSTPQQYKKIK